MELDALLKLTCFSAASYRDITPPRYLEIIISHPGTQKKTKQKCMRWLGDTVSSSPIAWLMRISCCGAVRWLKWIMLDCVSNTFLLLCSGKSVHLATTGQTPGQELFRDKYTTLGLYSAGPMSVKDLSTYTYHNLIINRPWSLAWFPQSSLNIKLS